MEFSQGLISAAYIVAALLFIFSLSGLSKQETAETGNWYGIIGMSIALIATIADPRVDNVLVIFVAMSVGAFIGLHLAKKVEMTQMPELVAILHSFVGLAAVLVGFNSYFEMDHSLTANLTDTQQMATNIHLVEVFLGVFIGAVTFTGSIVAFAKLRGIISSSALMLPHRHKLNLVAGVVTFILMISFVQSDGSVSALYFMTFIALVFGWHLVASIGGADMPVVIALLNSYSGIAAALAGFVLGNTVLIIAGSLVGTSGLILTQIMCVAMNRSLANVLFGKMAAGGETVDADEIYAGKVTSAQPDDHFMVLVKRRFCHDIYESKLVFSVFPYLGFLLVKV